MKVYHQKDLLEDRMAGTTTAVLGYGNQGHAHAQNLRDGGIDVVVGARPGGTGWKRAEKDGFEARPIADAVARADYVAILLPDEEQGALFDTSIAASLKPGAALVFAHGFTIAFREIVPPDGHDIILVAPKGQGHYVRKLYVEGTGVPCLLGVEVDASGDALQKALSYAHYCGCLRAGAIESSFREEAVTDLFGEQAVLCGGVPELVKAAFETLVENGYTPEVAYIECLHELKIITDLMHRGGIAFMRKLISRTAAWGGFESGGRLISDDIKAEMKSILNAIESGQFARGWMEEARSGQQRLSSLLDTESGHTIEDAGVAVRALLPDPKKE
jgi:ketol-acid reductoisomerase